MRAGDVILNLKLVHSIPAVAVTLYPFADQTKRILGTPEIHVPKSLGQSVANFHIGHGFSRADSWADREWMEGKTRFFNSLFRVLGGQNPTLWLKGMWVREVFFVMVDSIDRAANIISFWNQLTINEDSSGTNFSPQETSDGRR